MPYLSMIFIIFAFVSLPTHTHNNHLTTAQLLLSSLLQSAGLTFIILYALFHLTSRTVGEFELVPIRGTGQFTSFHFLLTLPRRAH